MTLINSLNSFLPDFIYYFRLFSFLSLSFDEALAYYDSFLIEIDYSIDSIESICYRSDHHHKLLTNYFAFHHFSYFVWIYLFLGITQIIFFSSISCCFSLFYLTSFPIFHPYSLIGYYSYFCASNFCSNSEGCWIYYLNSLIYSFYKISQTSTHLHLRCQPDCYQHHSFYLLDIFSTF